MLLTLRAPVPLRMLARGGGELLAAGKEVSESNDRQHGRDNRKCGSGGI